MFLQTKFVSFVRRSLESEGHFSREPVMVAYGSNFFIM